MNEQQRVESISDWYLTEQLGIDKQIIYYRYLSMQPYFVGRKGLELGPAEGEMTQFLVGHFEQLTIVEGSATLLAQIPDASNLTKVHSLFEDYKPQQKFDTIIADHVLEHVDEPIQLLRLMQNWIAPGGVFLLGVPNANSIHRLAAVKMGLLKDQYELNERDQMLGHRRVYDPALLEQHITEAGMDIVMSGGVFFKPLTYSQIQATWTPAMVAGFYELGKDFPDYAAEIFAVCKAA